MFAGYDTDKGDLHSYTETYEGLFADRLNVWGVLELGIYHGGSLRAFRDYFPNAEIVGLDIHPQTMIHGEERIHTICGNVREPKALLEAAQYLGSYTLIVDDASHLPIDQFQALKHLWPFVEKDGYYIIEDLDLNRQGAQVLTTCSLILRNQNVGITLHLGDGRNDDMLVLEKQQRGN